MSEHFFSRQLAEYMRDKVYAELGSELALKACHVGDLDPFPTDPSLIADIVPGIFFQVEDLASDFATLNQRYHHYYTFRIIYVGYLPEGVTQESARRVIERVADVVVEDLILNTTPTPSGALSFGSPAKGQVIWSVVRNVQYRPPEDNFVFQANANLFATALTWQIRMLMFK